MSLIKPNQMNFVPKRWGYELWICNNDKYCGKKIFLKQGRHLSYHHHDVKDEVLFIESGEIMMTFGQNAENFETIKMESGFAFHVEPGLRHQMFAVKDTMILEFSTTHSDEDSYRTTTDLIDGQVDL